jgi:hypothetical protein
LKYKAKLRAGKDIEEYQLALQLAKAASTTIK